MQPLVFIHGKPFANGGSGLALRTRLAFDALSEACAGRERHLVAPMGDAERNLAISLGWITHPVSTFDDSYPAAIRAALRTFVFAASPVSRSFRRLLLTMLGGGDVRFKPIRRLLYRVGPSDIWLARCDLLHLVDAAPPGSRVILDANDSVANLVRCYDPRSHVRKIALRRLESVAADIEREELRLADKCARIVAISTEDLAYYSRSECRSVLLEESCLVTPGFSRAAEAAWDVGFIGGPHVGSLSAAVNLLRIGAKPELAHLRFGIAGSVCDKLSGHICTPNVHLVGRVSSAPEFLSSCRQVLFWSERETGTSVKFQEAVLSGTTVLANMPAARWSRAIPGRDYIRCETEMELEAHLRRRTLLAPSPLRSACVKSRIYARFGELIDF